MGRRGILQWAREEHPLQFAQRVQKLPPYLFVEISRKMAEKRAQGADLVTFGIGDPDIPTPQHILHRLMEASKDPSNHRYPETDGLPELRRAIAEWYLRRFGLTLNPDTEVLSLIGAKEGIGHMPLCLIDPGDTVLVPDPGYPVYAVGTLFAGGDSYLMPLKEEKGWLPDLEAIPQEVARKAKMMWLNYPNNPTGAVAGLDYFTSVVRFAREHHIAVCHDAAYSEVTFDGYRAPSFLQVEGAMEVGVEFHSFSKTYNMTGWRIGMAVGNAEMINSLMRVKSNLDSGVPQAIQYAAIEALSSSQACVAQNNAVYQRRRDTLVEALREIGLYAETPRSGLYIWCRLPGGWRSAEFAAHLLEEKSIVVTPGRGYGEYGEGYIRLSLTTPDERVEEGVRRLKSWRIPDPVGAQGR